VCVATDEGGDGTDDSQDDSWRHAGETYYVAGGGARRPTVAASVSLGTVRRWLSRRWP
jgi:hypothetical protein